MKKESVFTKSTALALALLMMAALCGCGGNGTAAEPIATAEPAAQIELPDAAQAEAGRRDGERFEEVIILEGMEEKVGYEHARNEAAGFELDFEYEALERRSLDNGECLVSVYDLPDAPMNYLEVTALAEDAESAAAAVEAELRESFDTVVTETIVLEHAGQCLRISASGAKGGGIQGPLQTVYVIPAAGGCLVARAHCTVESAEGFGARFAYMLNTLALIG